MPTNPFRIGEHVRAPYFTNRAAELRTVLGAMRDRGRVASVTQPLDRLISGRHTWGKGDSYYS